MDGEARRTPARRAGHRAPGRRVVAAAVTMVLVATALSFAERLDAIEGPALRGRQAATDRRPMQLPLRARPLSVVWAGDSVAQSLGDAVVGSAAERDVTVTDRSISGCGMVRGFPADEDFGIIASAAPCDAALPIAQTEIAALHPDVVVWLSTWESANRIVDGRTLRFGTRAGDRALIALIDESVKRLTANGAVVVFLTAPVRSWRPNLVGHFAGTPYAVPPVATSELREHSHLNALLRRYAERHPTTTAVVDLEQIVCGRRLPCPHHVAGIAARPIDGRHFAGAGATWVADQLVHRLVGRGHPWRW